MFILFWSGKGWLVPVAIVLNILVTGLIGKAFGLKDATISIYILEFIIGLAFFIPLWFAGKKMNAETQTLIDKKTGREFVIKNRNKFFAIPIQYWAIIWPTILILIFAAS